MCLSAKKNEIQEKKYQMLLKERNHFRSAMEHALHSAREAHTAGGLGRAAAAHINNILAAGLRGETLEEFTGLTPEEYAEEDEEPENTDAPALDDPRLPGAR